MKKKRLIPTKWLWQPDTANDIKIDQMNAKTKHSTEYKQQLKAGE